MKGWEFVSFVRGNFEEADIRKQIIMIVRNTFTKEVKLVMIFIDPWKNIDFDSDQPFDVPENIFVVRNSDIFLPKSIDLVNMFSDDKIKAVSILPA